MPGLHVHSSGVSLLNKALLFGIDGSSHRTHDRYQRAAAYRGTTAHASAILGYGGLNEEEEVRAKARTAPCGDTAGATAQHE